jgi:formate dehydrogenase major subunit
MIAASCQPRLRQPARASSSTPAQWVIRWSAEKRAWEGDVPDGALRPARPIPSSCWPREWASSTRRTSWTGRSPSTTSRWRARSATCSRKTESSPCAQIWRASEFDRYGTPDVFPSSPRPYRVSEHWQTGAMSRNNVLARRPHAERVRRDRHGARAARRDQERRPRDREQRAGLHRGPTRSSPSASSPFFVDDRLVDEIGLPWHWGYAAS